MFAGEENEIIISIMSTFTNSFFLVSPGQKGEKLMTWCCVRSLTSTHKTLDFNLCFICSGGFNSWREIWGTTLEHAGAADEQCWRDIMHIEREYPLNVRFSARSITHPHIECDVTVIGSDAEWSLIKFCALSHVSLHVTFDRKYWFQWNCSISFLFLSFPIHGTKPFAFILR